MTDPQRVCVTGGNVGVDLGVGWFFLVAGVWSVALAVSGMKKDIAAAIDRNTAAMEAPACVPIEVEPLKPPAVLENR